MRRIRGVSRGRRVEKSGGSKAPISEEILRAAETYNVEFVLNTFVAFYKPMKIGLRKLGKKLGVNRVTVIMKAG